MATNGRGDSGLTTAQKVLGLTLGALSLLAIIAGGVYAWSDLQHQVCDNATGVAACEASVEKVHVETGNRIERLEESQARTERKVDRLLILQGIDPEAIH